VDIGEGHVGILNAPASLELTSLLHSDAGCIHIEDEGSVNLLVCALALWDRDPHGSTAVQLPLRRHSCDQRDIAGMEPFVHHSFSPFTTNAVPLESAPLQFGY
jgi:hypothetical protein